ncbi:sulfatase-like hydrolase/transferase [Algisphaera agarilytica]|uniref:Arylsulfatase A-like enzyme n=1 Tax=Algisphaera agarilytica TaxID=1385975 RepID=A0A7X0HAP5_9BACT|nr:sulfatase-like hydrolase/transferase [Algisphaera agarilytica]MBB6430914.1 arylsulfatase A-like enzyme [Algisphaera agarilytica]
MDIVASACRSFSWFVVLAAVLTAAIAQAGEQPPNILWIITDDQRSDSLAVYNQVTTGKAESPLGFVMSPRIDQLAAEGVFFTNAYCNSPACAPSRSSMHTGKYPHRNGMFGFRPAHQKVDVASRMVPEVMKEHGYQTAHFGKSGYYIFDYPGRQTYNQIGHYETFVSRRMLQESDGSDFWFNRPWGTHNGKGGVLGTEEVFRFPDGTVKRFWRERRDAEITEEDIAQRKAVEEELDILRTYTRSNPNLIIGGVSSNTTWNTLDGATAKSMQEYLAQEGQPYTLVDGKTKANGPDPSRPVFIHLGFSAPHTPVMPSKEYRDKFAGQTYKVPAFSDREIELLPETLQQMHNDMNFSRMTDDEQQQAIRDYYALCAMLDELVGASVDSFKAYSEKRGQDFLIVYVCGDHGWHLGEQGIEAKFGPWYQSNHGSVIVVSSDQEKYPPGTVYDGFIEYVDFAPTIYESASVPTSAHPGLDGFALNHILTGEAVQRDYVIGEFNQVRGERAYLRTKDFAFSMRARPYFTKPGEGYAPGERNMWGLEASAEEVEMSLYDLRIDPHERVNLAYHELYVELAAFLRNKLGRIILGDGRVEVDWKQENVYHVSDFAPGAHDRKLDIPADILPEPQVPEAYADLIEKN